MKLLNGNNLELLKTLEDNSVDSIVTDPPYGLSFMNKKWDYDVPSVELWKECYRVLKPGGHILSFGGTRTYHRMVVNIEDAGFEIRDQIMWIYGSGFPKSLNIGKALDKLQGNKREVVGEEKRQLKNSKVNQHRRGEDNRPIIDYNITKGQSEYEGWGTALKPANEPICVARKPLSENTVAENVLKWGTAGINVDGCRIDLSGDDTSRKLIETNVEIYGWSNHKGKIGSMDDKWKEGRFPANIIFECICDEVIKGENKGKTPANYERTYKDNNPTKLTNNVKSGEHYNDTADIHTNPHCPCFMLDKQSGISKSRDKYPEVTLDNMPMNHYDGTKIKHQSGKDQTKEFISDKGGASRFFYVAKVSKKERNMGIEEFEEKETNGIDNYNDSGDIHTNPNCPCYMLDKQSGILKSGDGKSGVHKINRNGTTDGVCKMDMGKGQGIHYGDKGGASRFFYVAKVSKKERNMGIEEFEEKETNGSIGLRTIGGTPLYEKGNSELANKRVQKNIHPTVKPINLMTYLCRLVTPKGGVVLDPYMGSGSTGIAAKLEGFDFIGMEMDKDYFDIAEGRINNYEEYRQLLKK